jgi:hypothetical protein
MRPRRCRRRGRELISSSDSFLERRVAVAFDHELRRPPNVAKAATAVDKGLRPDPAASQGWER